MPSKNKNSSWNRAIPSAVDSIVLPEKIPCRGCNITKNLSAFSAAQQFALKQRIHERGARNTNFLPASEKWIVCLTCNRQQRDEFLCYGCDEWKARHAFSKVQLRYPDEAQCWSCVQKRLNEEPGAGSDDSCSGGSDDDDDDDDYDAYSFSDDEGTIAGTYSGAPSTFAGPSSGIGGGVALRASSRPTPTHSAAIAGWADNDQTSVIESEFSYTTGRAASQAPSMIGRGSVFDETSGGGKFAKVKAGYRPVQFSYVEEEKARKQAAKEEARKKSKLGVFGGRGAGPVGRDEDDISVVESEDSEDEDDE